MNLHESDIRSRLTRLLDRKQMPKRLDGKGGAMEDEIGALTNAVLRNAPRSAEQLAEWWPHFESALGEIAVGGLWPTEREIRDAAKAVKSIAPNVAVALEAKTAHQMVADRMAKGEPVGEGWLYGRSACELIKQGLVDRDTMTRYRSAAFFARKEAYGEAAARAWEDAERERHEVAKASFRDQTPHHGAVDVGVKHFGGEAA